MVLVWNGFSLAPSFTVRKVKDLRPGYAVGDLVSTGDASDYLKDHVGYGFGLVAYFTPQLFKASSGKAPAASDDTSNDTTTAGVQ